jgi:hypothetical protein
MIGPEAATGDSTSWQFDDDVVVEQVADGSGTLLTPVFSIGKSSRGGKDLGIYTSFPAIAPVGPSFKCAASSGDTMTYYD